MRKEPDPYTMSGWAYVPINNEEQDNFERMIVLDTFGPKLYNNEVIAKIETKGE